jgi:protein ImuA
MMDAKTNVVEKLRQDLLLWQGYKPVAAASAEQIGLGEIEQAFPGGVFPKRAIHEFITVIAEHAAASDGFIAGLLAVLMEDGASCVWVSTSRRLFPTALASFNVSPERIIFIDVNTQNDALWIMEEALKCEGLAAVVGELDQLSLTASRRLQLAVEESGVTGFILRKDASKNASSIAAARWQISPLPSQAEEGLPGLGFPRWQVELLKVRNGNPGKWELDWDGEGFAPLATPPQEIPETTQQERQVS